MEKLEQLEHAVSGVVTMEMSTMIAREAIKIARKIYATDKREIERYLKIICEERIETAKLRLFLREAVRYWVMRTPDVEEAVLAWQRAKEAGL